MMIEADLGSLRVVLSSMDALMRTKERESFTRLAGSCRLSRLAAPWTRIRHQLGAPRFGNVLTTQPVA